MNTQMRSVTLTEAFCFIREARGPFDYVAHIAQLEEWFEPGSIGLDDIKNVQWLIHLCVPFFEKGMGIRDIGAVWEDWYRMTRLLSQDLLRHPELNSAIYEANEDGHHLNPTALEMAKALVMKSNALAWGKEMPLEVAFALGKQTRRHVRPSWRMVAVDAILGALPPEADTLALTKRSWAVAKAFELKAMMTALEQIQNALTLAESVKNQP